MHRRIARCPSASKQKIGVITLLLAGLGCGLPAVADDNTATVVISAARPDALAAQRFPASISVVDVAQAADATARRDLSDVLTAVPGLVAQSRQNDAQDLQISSRGFGARAPFGVRGLRLVVDGIPASMPDGQGQVSHIDLGSAARIEVLRGPFSVLHGNAAGGVIAVTSDSGVRDPGLAASLAAGDDGLVRESLRLGWATTPGDDGAQWSALGSASALRSDGFRQHSASERRQENLRLAWQNDTQRVVLVGNRLDMPLALDPQGLTRAQWQANPRAAAAGALAYDTRKSLQQAQVGVSASSNYSRGGTAQISAWQGTRDVVQFQSIPRAVQAAPTHGGGVIDLARDFDGVDARVTQALPILAGEWLVTLGVGRENQLDDRRGYENFVGTQLGVRGALRRDENNRFVANSQYAQLEWRPADAWLWVIGARHSTLEVTSTDRYITANNPDDSGTQRYAATTPAIGVSWQATPQWRLHMAWGEGFETPTGNELAYRPDGGSGLNTGLRAATSRHVELGAKARGDFGRLDVALFGVRTRDEIVVASSSGGRTAYANGGDTHRHGLELAWQHQLKLTPASSLDIQAAATWLVARYAGDNPFAGHQLPGVPARSLVANVLWQGAPHAAIGQPFAGVEWHAVARVMANDANDQAAPGYATASLRAGLRGNVGKALHWQWFARLDNLFDRRYAATVIVNEGNGRYFEPSPGRTALLGLDVTLRY